MKTSLGSAALVGVTFAAVMACYAVSIRVGSERTGVERVRATIAADTRDIRMLQAELRTRARLPELQRWNEQVLALSPPKPGQFLGSPLVLANYARPAAEAPGVRFVATPALPAAKRAVQQVAYLETPTGAVPAPGVEAAAAPVPVRRAPPQVHAPTATPSIALDATLGGAIDAAAAQERGDVKVALR